MLTPISALSEHELAAVNQARREDGKPLFASSVKAVQASAPFLRSIVAQDGSGLPGPGGESTYEIRIKNTSNSLEPAPPGTIPQTQPGTSKPGTQPPRWTEPSPSPPLTPPPAPPASSAFDAGVQAERERALFGDRLRIAVARRLQKTAQSSRDPVAIALAQQKKEIVIEPAPSLPRSRALTEEERSFADVLCRKIARALPAEARAWMIVDDRPPIPEQIMGTRTASLFHEQVLHGRVNLPNCFCFKRSDPATFSTND